MVEAELKKAPAEADSQVLKDLNSLLKRERVMEADWLEFEARFNQVIRPSVGSATTQGVEWPSGVIASGER